MTYLEKLKSLKPATDKTDKTQKLVPSRISSVSSAPDLAISKIEDTFVGFVGDRFGDYIFGDPHQSAVTWRLTFADPACAVTHYVSAPPTTRAEVFARFADQGLLSCEPDQSCRSCGWRIAQGLIGSPIYCANPKLRGVLKPVYSDGHPAREPPADSGATCFHHTTAKVQSQPP